MGIEIVNDPKEKVLKPNDKKIVQLQSFPRVKLDDSIYVNFPVERIRVAPVTGRPEIVYITYMTKDGSVKGNEFRELELFILGCEASLDYWAEEIAYKIREHIRKNCGEDNTIKT